MSLRGESEARVDNALSLLPSLGSLSLNNSDDNQGAYGRPYPIEGKAKGSWFKDDGTFNYELLDEHAKKENKKSLWIEYYPPIKGQEYSIGSTDEKVTWTSFYPEGRDKTHNSPHYMHESFLEKLPDNKEDAYEQLLSWMKKKDKEKHTNAEKAYNNGELDELFLILEKYNEVELPPG